MGNQASEGSIPEEGGDNNKRKRLEALKENVAIITICKGSDLLSPTFRK